MAEKALTAAEVAALSASGADGLFALFVHYLEYEDYFVKGIRNSRMLLDGMRPLAGLRVYQEDSDPLDYGVTAGDFYNGTTLVEYAGAAAQALADDDTNYIYLEPDGTLVDNVTGFPSTPHIPLATILTASGDYAYSDITDCRGRAVFGVARSDDGAVEAVTAGVGSPNILTAAESGKVLTNEGATALVYNTLPAAAAGLEFTGIVKDTDGLRFTAGAGDTIRLAGSVSVAAGYVEATAIGCAVRLKAINATEWIATCIVGSWTVETS